MYLIYQAIYRIISLSVFYIPRSHHDYSVLTATYESMITLKVVRIEKKNNSLLVYLFVNIGNNFVLLCRNTCYQMHASALLFIDKQYFNKPFDRSIPLNLSIPPRTVTVKIMMIVKIVMVVEIYCIQHIYFHPSKVFFLFFFFGVSIEKRKNRLIL